MKAKQIYEIILEAYGQDPLEQHRRVKFKTGPFKGYEMGDIVDKLPYTMSQLYIDLVPEGARGEMFKESLRVLLDDAKRRGLTTDDAKFRTFFPNLYNDLIKYGRNAGYTLKELHRFKPNAELHMATGGERIADNLSLANKARQQLGMKDYTEGVGERETEYLARTNKEAEPKVQYKDPTMWSKGKKILRDLTCIIRETNGKLIKTRFEGDELDVELQLLGVTTEGYPIAIHTLASKIAPEYLMYAENLTKTYTPITDDSLAIHMVDISKAINDGIHKIDGIPYVNLQVNSDNITVHTVRDME